MPNTNDESRAGAADQQLAELKLVESQLSYQSLFENSLVGISQALPDGRYYRVNQAYARMYGYSSPEELIAKVTDIGRQIYANPQERAEVVKILAEQGEMGPREFQVRRRDGTIFSVLVAARQVKDNNGVLLYSQHTHIDITERKRAEEQLLYQAKLLANVSEAIISTDMEFNIKSWNKAAETIYGWSAEEVVGKVMDAVVPITYVDTQPEDVIAQFRQEGQWQGEVVQRVKDGTQRYILSSVTCLYDESGQPAGAVAVNRDITDRKRLEAENVRLAAQYYQAQKMESIGRLAGGIAHDFNNLLVPIVGFAQLGMMRLAPDSPLQGNFKRIIEAAERATRLIRQILAISRHQELELQLLGLNQVINELEPMLRRLIGEDNTLHLRLAPSLPAIHADKGQIEQVALNLVVNACDAMAGGGELTIATALEAADETFAAKHAQLAPGPYVLLIVSDTGHGMDAATQERIFEPFFTTKPQGTGLGLPTVFGIVKQHHGSIAVESERGQGTTFKIYLPAADTLLSPAPPEDLQVVTLGGSETVLLVEDEASVRQLVCDILRAHGYRVLVAADPAQALALAAADDARIHVLLTDVILPQMNGRRLFEELVARRPEIKVLYMSGYADDILSQHAVAVDRAGFLAKPFTVNGLLQKVRAVLGKTVDQNR